MHTLRGLPAARPRAASTAARVPECDDPLIGAALPGGYLVLDVVGRGAMGVVYRAAQTALDRIVAVKVLHRNLLCDTTATRRFLLEARAAGRLSHPNVVAVFAFGQTEQGLAYLVMEHVRGRDLSRIATPARALPVERCVAIARQVLFALDEAHSRGIVHRDIKPSNILLERTRSGADHVKVADFGLAKILSEPKGRAITCAGTLCGSPWYVAPERSKGGGDGPGADVYSTGVVLFQMLTGVVPFDGASASEILDKHVSEPIPDPRSVESGRGIPAPLAAVVVKALEKTPERRYRSAEEMAAALRRAANEAGVGDWRREAGPSSAPPGLASSQEGLAAQPSGAEASRTVRSTRSRPTPEGIRSLELPLELVGHDDELEWLYGLLEGGEAPVVARLVGAAGMGKTRLAAAFADAARACGHPVALAGPDPWQARVGGWTLRRIVCDLGPARPAEWPGGGCVGEESQAREGLSALMHDDRVPSSARSACVPREAFSAALRRAVERAWEAAGGRRVVVVVDDLDLVDGVTRNALADLVSRPVRARLTVLCAHEPGFDPRWPGHPRRSLLPGLSARDAAELLRGVVSRSVIAALDDGTAPMLVEQLIRHSCGGSGSPPTRLDELVRARLSRLSSGHRDVLGSLAVLGDDMPLELLERLSGHGSAATAACALMSAGMIVLERDRARFSHPLVRRAAYEALGAARRRALHDLAVDLAAEQGHPLEVRARHAHAAGRTLAALCLLELAGDRAARRGDHAGAGELFHRGLDLARREIDHDEVFDSTRAVLVFGHKLGEALHATGRPEEARRIREEATAVACPGGAPDPEARLLLARLAVASGRCAEAFEHLREGIARARSQGATGLLDSLLEAERLLRERESAIALS